MSMKTDKYGRIKLTWATTAWVIAFWLFFGLLFKFVMEFLVMGKVPWFLN